MAPLPANAPDRDLIGFVDAWARLMEAEDYAGAFEWTAHDPRAHWTPALLEQVVKSYGPRLPGQRVTVDGRPADVSQRKDVVRIDPPRDGRAGSIWYDLNIDGRVSDLTATFDVFADAGGLRVRLDDIHVL